MSSRHLPRLLYLLPIFLILISSIIIILISNNRTHPSPPTEVSNWKTYSNSKYGFSFDYPPTWTILYTNNSVDRPPTEPTVSPPLSDSVLFKAPQFNPLVNVMPNHKSLTLTDYFVQNHWSKEWLDNAQTIKIGPYEGIKMPYGTIYVGNKDIIVGLDIQFGSPTASHLLSTFKFLN